MAADEKKDDSRSLDATLDRDATVTRLGAPTSAGERFLILRPHARGGLGVVFIALDGELHREVALKQIREDHADDGQRRGRFLLEAEITGGLEHPGIVPVYGLGTDAQGRPFYAMRFIRGDSLEEAIAEFHGDDSLRADAGRRSLELRKLLRRFLDVCNAIEYAHSRGVLHRDLKPGNIIVGRFGETLVIDWGLAKAQGRAEGMAPSEERPLRPYSGSGSAETVVGSAIGTPGYMSPEQARGDLESLGPTSDVYSLGATLYCLLVGRQPFERTDIGSVLRNVQKGRFKRPRMVEPLVDPALEAVCLKAMALSQADRYQSAQALADDVERWIADEPVTAYRDPLLTRVTRWGRRHRAAAASIAVLVGSTVLALGVGSLLVNRERVAAEANFQKTRQAVDQYFTAVSESKLLNVPGLQPLRRELLEAASDYYRDFLKERGDDPAVRREAAMASVRVGSVESAMGRPEEALRNYESAVRLYQDALRDDPSNLELRRQLAIAYGSEGYVLNFRLRAKEALAAHGKALEVQEAIARERPDEVKAQIDVARTRGNMALAHRMLGENSDALAEWDRAVAIATPLLDKPLPPARNATQDLTGRTDLSRIVREVLGGLHLEESHALLDLNRLDEARRHAEAGRALFDRLTRDYPTDLALKASLSNAYSALSAPEREAGLLEEANRDMLRCLEILDALTAENPTVLEYRTDLAYALLLHGYVLERLDKPADADANYRRLMNVAEALFSIEPGSARTRNLLAQALQKRAGTLIQAHRLADALPLARRGVELLESLVREQPDSVYNRSALGAGLRMLGLVEAEAGLTREAFTTYERALDAQRPLINKLPVERYNQACALAQISRLVPPERRDTQAAAAVQMLGQALADGYSDAGLVATDTDLDPLRGRADFKALLAMHGISQRR